MAGLCVCLTRDQVFGFPTPPLSCSLFHLRTPTRHCRSPFWGSLGGPGLSENPGSYLGEVAPTTLPAHHSPPLPPIPLSSRPEGLAGDEVTSPLKPHPASTPSLRIRKYDWGTSSPGAGAAQGVAGLLLCPSLSWESPGPGRSQNLPQSPQEEKQNLDILYHWLGWKVTGCLIPLRDATEQNQGHL